MWRKLFGGARRRALQGLDQEIHDHIDILERLPGVVAIPARRATRVDPLGSIRAE